MYNALAWYKQFHNVIHAWYILFEDTAVHARRYALVEMSLVARMFAYLICALRCGFSPEARCAYTMWT